MQRNRFTDLQDQNKSHVSMGEHICIICTKKYDSGAILLDMQLRKRMESHTLTGSGMCPECTDQSKTHIALVVINPSKSTVIDNLIKPQDAYRTGKIIWLRNEVFPRIFNLDLSKGKFMFIEEEAASKLEKIKVEGTGGYGLIGLT